MFVVGADHLDEGVWVDNGATAISVPPTAQAMLHSAASVCATRRERLSRARAVIGELVLQRCEDRRANGGIQAGGAHRDRKRSRKPAVGHSGSERTDGLPG